MKKSIFLVACMVLLSWYNYAALYVINNTNCNVRFTIFAHDAANPTCGYYQSGAVVVSAPMSFASYSSFAALTPSWYNAPNYNSLNPAPTTAPIWDYFKFFITDVSTCNVYATVGSSTCSVPATYAGTCVSCASATLPVNLSWGVIGPNTYVSIDY